MYLCRSIRRDACRDETQVYFFYPYSLIVWHFAGKATGMVTTARLTHASPGAGYAVSADRTWESDSDLNPAHEGKCKDIAAQLIDDHGYIQVRGSRYT